ncbi:ribonuclease H-like domain-containing protein, partial [Tanacetum coccineum]
IMETQAIDDQDPLVNYDNDNENDDLGYQSEEYFDEVQEDDENNHSNGNVVKRGITRLYKFRREYGKPDGIKLSVTFDALNMISGKHRALFLSFLGDMVREHIGLKILSWKKVDSKARDKLWDEITRYFDVDLTVRKLVKSASAKMARSKYVYQHTMGRGGYTLVKEKIIKKKEIKPDEKPARGTLWLKGRVNKDGEYPDDGIRSVGDKLRDHQLKGTGDVVERGEEREGPEPCLVMLLYQDSLDFEESSRIHLITTLLEQSKSERYRSRTKDELQGLLIQTREKGKEAKNELTVRKQQVVDIALAYFLKPQSDHGSISFVYILKTGSKINPYREQFIKFSVWFYSSSFAKKPCAGLTLPTATS